MSRGKQPEPRVPLKLTLAQREAVARLGPALAGRLKLDEPNQRVIDFTLAELMTLKGKAQPAVRRATNGMERLALLGRPLRFPRCE